MLPGEVELPQLALSWELYVAAQAPPEERVDGVMCDGGRSCEVAVLGNFSFTELKKQQYLVIVLISVVLFDCRPSTGVLRNTRRTRPRFSKPSASTYFRTYGMRLGCRLFETTTPRLTLGGPRRSVAPSI